YDTKIQFFYFFWFVRFGYGTFKAPAFIMLPLWLLQQIFFAGISTEASGVAVWAHIGGFLFGFCFVALLHVMKIEQKYISPGIEKKISLVQNPLFLKAMELSENENYPEALIHLEKVVRLEPNHLDAYMEMQRIAEIKKDGAAYNRYSSGIFDI